jgi:hypothetical protein
MVCELLNPLKNKRSVLIFVYNFEYTSNRSASAAEIFEEVENKSVPGMAFIKTFVEVKKSLNL